MARYSELHLVTYGTITFMPAMSSIASEANVDLCALFQMLEHFDFALLYNFRDGSFVHLIGGEEVEGVCHTKLM